MSYLIYKATNAKNGHFYIGLTGRLLIERMREHLGAANGKPTGCPALSKAIAKYGKAAFRWEILTDGLSYAEANAEEIRLIASLRPYYNVASGGNAAIGKALSKAVICINTGQRYDSGKAAAKALGIAQMTVSNLCRNGGQTMAGLRFRFADSPEVMRSPRSLEAIEAGKRSRIEKLRARVYSPETIERMRSAAKKRGVAASTRAAQKGATEKPVVCMETSEVFPSVTHAAAFYDVPRNTLYAAIYAGSAVRAIGKHFNYQ